MVKDFERKCERPDIWGKTTLEQFQLPNILEFLKNALSYSIEYPQVEKEITNGNTASVVFRIIPVTLRDRLFYKTR